MGESAGLLCGLLTCEFSWKRAEAQEGTELCRCILSNGIRHIYSHSVGPLAKKKGKGEENLH